MQYETQTDAPYLRTSMQLKQKQEHKCLQKFQIFNFISKSSS